MTFHKLLTRGGLLLALLVFLATSVMAQGGAARVRFVHVVPGAAALDVYINGALALKAVDYGAPTTYLTVPAGTHTVTITPSGLKNVLAEQSLTLSADSITTFVASDPATLAFVPFTEKLGDPTLGKGRLQLIHAAAGAPALEVQAAEDIAVGNGTTAAGTTIGTLEANKAAEFDLEAKTYPLQLASSGSVIMGDLNVPVTSGTSHLLIIYGTADALKTLLITTPASVPSGTGFVRFVHGIVGAPAVDVIINDTLIAPALSTDRPTEHIGLPAGDHSLVLRAAGSEDVLFEGDITVTEGAIETIVILQGDTEIELQPLDDAIGSVTAGSAGVSVINTIPGTDDIAVTIGGETVVDSVPFGQGSPAAPLAPIYAPLGLTITRSDQIGTIDLPAHTFYGGIYYTLIALDGGSFSGPRLLIVPTALSQGLASAPGAGTETIAVNAVPTQAEAATVAATQVADASTPAPTVPANTPAPLATKDPTIYGRVILDPGANLQLREYPNAEARSLGLAPAGTQFIINGRSGAPVALVADQGTPTPMPEATEFVDPVTLLDPADPKADLVKAETWLNVTYNTPDGGAIIAWVNAQYVDVRNAAGEITRLAVLPLVGSNLPGEARSTAITPPPLPEDRKTALVQGLDSDTNLNIRRTPETGGEVLGRVSNGTVLDLVGLNEAEEWAFVVYRPESGGTVSGWVSVSYLKYQLNSQDITLDDLKVAVSKFTDLPLYEVVPDDRRGAIGAGVEGVSLPTPDPLKNAFVAEVRLDQGANLQLRRNPNVDAESLALIPSGTQVVASARTEEADWLYVSFENTDGWISARYVVLTYNGNQADIENIPVFFDSTAATPVDGAAPAETTPAADATAVPAEATAVPTTGS